MKTISINSVKEVLNKYEIPHKLHFEGRNTTLKFKVSSINIDMDSGSINRKGDITVEINENWIAVGVAVDGDLSFSEDKSLFYTKTRDKLIEFDEIIFTPIEREGIKQKDLKDFGRLENVYLGDE